MLMCHHFTPLFNLFRKSVEETSSSGVNLEIVVESEITAGLEVEGVGISSTVKIPPAFQRVWGYSSNFQKVEKFFSEKQGLISTAIGNCVTYQMSLDTFELPSFTSPFKKAIAELYEASKSREDSQINTIAQYLFERKYSKLVRQTVDLETLKNCNYLSGTKIYGILKDHKKCKSSDQDKLNSFGRDNVEEIISTKGSCPTDIHTWAIQSFTRVPLKFKLSPIFSLFQDRYIITSNLESNCQKISSTLPVRKWLVPLYHKYCNVMGVDCSIKN